jgi:hypothetical protein
MKTLKPQALVVTVMILAFSLAFWAGLLVLEYVGDDWSSPPADSKSIPAEKTY